jgi:tetratricopeptide (TPR) repeat protein
MPRNAPPLSRSIRLLFGAALIAGAASIAAHTLPAAHAAAGDLQTCEQASGDEPIAACTRAIASGAYQGHDLAKLHYDRAFEYQARRDNDRAIADYSESIRLNPNSAMALYLRGVAKQKKGDKAGGTTDIAAAKRIDPNAAGIEDHDFVGRLGPLYSPEGYYFRFAN